MPDLTPTDHRILTAAADRADAALLPLPEGLRLHGAARRRVLAKLQAMDLAIEGQPGELHLSEAGYRIAGREPIVPEEPPLVTIVTPPVPPPRMLPQGLGSLPRPGSKLALLIDLLCSEGGVSLDDLVEPTGWQPHTVRATLTHLRRRGMIITHRKSNAGTTVYEAATSAEPIEASPEAAA